MLDGVLRQAGNRTGCYTSPHLVRFNERIRIAGAVASDADICHALSRIEQARDGIPLTYFEFGTLAALLVFEQYNVDIAILEVGMGGRLDAVNIVHNDLVLMTSIDVDHAQWLGADRESIGAEKAGVIKHGGIVVCTDADTPNSVLAIAKQQNATLIRASKDYSIDAISNEVIATTVAENTTGETRLCWKSNHTDIPQDWRCLSPLVAPFGGKHQITNLGGVVATLALSCDKTGVSTTDLVPGLGRSKLSARCQVLTKRSTNCPEVIVDVAHNRASAGELARFLAERTCAGATYAIIGVLADKQIKHIIDPVMAYIDYWFLATLAGERGQTGIQLADKLKQIVDDAKPPRCPKWETSDNPVAAYSAAIARAKAEDRVVVFGSFYTVGDIINHLE